MKIHVKLLLVLLIAFIAVIPVQADEIDIIVPDEQTGVYSYEYSAQPDTNYIVVVLEGLYEQGTFPDITDTSVLYYNPVTSDSQGNLEIQVNPMYYRDSTMFIGAGDLASPVVVCYLKPDEKYQLFTIELEADEYTADGGNRDILVKYVIKDYFGNEVTLPYDAELKFDNYSGSEMTFENTNNIIRVNPNIEEGTYSLFVAGEEKALSGTVSFTVNRLAPVAKKLIVTVNGNNTDSFSVECISNAESFTFSPEEVDIKAELLDQYEEVMDGVTYKFSSIMIDQDGQVNNSVVLYEGVENSYKFIFDEYVETGKTVEYEISVHASHSQGNFFDETLSITIEGNHSYSGVAEQLYLNYVKAMGYINDTDAGRIKISADGNDVVYTSKYVKQDAVDTLIQAVDSSKAILMKITSGERVFDSTITNENKKLTGEITAFERQLKNGNIRPIESITFSSIVSKLALGKYVVNEAETIPTRITETLVYESSDESVATVDAKTGKVTAIAEGQATITAYNTGYNPDRTVTASYNIIVFKPITSIEFSVDKAELVAGESMQTTLITVPVAGEHSDKVTYKSSDTKIATVAANGLVKAKKSGNVTITAKTQDSLEAEIDIKINTPNVYSVYDRLAKPAGQIEIPVCAEKMRGVTELEVKMTYPSAVMTFDNAVDAQIVHGFEGAQETQPGTVVAKWVSTEQTQITEDAFAKFYLNVVENATYGEYKVTFTISGKTAGGDTVVFEKKTISVKVVVGEKDTYTVKVVASTGGSAAGGGEYKYGEQVEVRAYPSSSYTFLDWYANSKTVSTDKEYTFTVTESIEIRARFEKKSSGGGGGGGGGGSYGGGGGGSYGGGGGGYAGTSSNTVSTVISSAPSGAVPYGTLISLYTPTEDATIYYTLDGTIPAASSGILYTGPIRLTESVVRISAIGVKSGMVGSSVSTFTYQVQQPQPVSVKLKENAAQIKYLDVQGTVIEPDRAATRYEVVRMLKIFDVSGGNNTVTFTDVPSYNIGLVEPYVKAGIINGYPDGTFGGDKGITRAELVKILCIMLGLDTSQVDISGVTLSDIEGHWAKDYIKLFVAKGYILGYPEGDFRPDNPVSRAEAVTILNRITAINKTSGMQQYFTDLSPEHWAYDEIMNVADIYIEESAEA